MAGRYMVTGVQLGMLIALSEQSDRQELVDKIVDKQFVGNSNRDIKKDCDCWRVENSIEKR